MPFHLAAIVSVPLCQKHPVESYKTNVLGVAVVLNAALAEGGSRGRIPRVVFSSMAAEDALKAYKVVDIQNPEAEVKAAAGMTAIKGGKPTTGISR